MALSVVILAAGQGTRMRSSLPKVLHTVGGHAMLERVVHTAQALDADKIIVIYGNGGEQLPQTFTHLPVIWVCQEQQLGTGHALAQALPYVAETDDVLVLYGDVPLIQASTLQKLNGGDVNVLTANFTDPGALGRIVRDDAGNIQAIVEFRDADAQTRAIQEINSGILSTRAELLQRWLPQLENQNAQGEYYLTDIIAMAVREGLHVTSQMAEADEVRGVNDRKELATMERLLQQRQAQDLLEQGLTLLDPSRFDLRGTLTAGKDVVIDVNVIIEGDVVLGDGVFVGPNCVLKNTQVGDGARIEPYSLLEGASVGADCTVGPFARLRPGSVMKTGAKVGNFVEMKKTTLGEGSKASHLSYLGDATIGSQVNIGAGTITCNYDGTHKHVTVIEDHAFIGSDTQLVAPVRVGCGAVIGAGSTITKDAPAGELTLSRVAQRTVEGWGRGK